MLASCSELQTTLGFFVPWRLSGLLSGYLPTDTRPQARAKLGKSGDRVFAPTSQPLIWLGANFLQRKFALWRKGRLI